VELPRGLSARGGAFILGGVKIKIASQEPTTWGVKPLDPGISFPTLPHTLEHL
jgi:hypothetical protein